MRKPKKNPALDKIVADDINSGIKMAQDEDYYDFINLDGDTEANAPPKTKKDLPSTTEFIRIIEKKMVGKALDLATTFKGKRESKEFIELPVEKTEHPTEMLPVIQPISRKDYESRVYLWLLDGWTPKKISDELIANYGVRNETAASKIIRSVTYSTVMVETTDMNELKARYVEMYGDIYRRALEKKDYGTAKNILDSVVKLQGLITKQSVSRIENVFTVDFN